MAEVSLKYLIYFSYVPCCDELFLSSLDWGRKKFGRNPTRWSYIRVTYRNGKPYDMFGFKDLEDRFMFDLLWGR